MNYWLEKNNFTLRHYENNQFYKKIKKYLRIIYKCTCGRDFWYLLVTFSKHKKIPIKQKMKLSEFWNKYLTNYLWNGK